MWFGFSLIIGFCFLFSLFIGKCFESMTGQSCFPVGFEFDLSQCITKLKLQSKDTATSTFLYMFEKWPTCLRQINTALEIFVNFLLASKSFKFQILLVCSIHCNCKKRHLLDQHLPYLHFFINLKISLRDLISKFLFMCCVLI